MENKPEFSRKDIYMLIIGLIFTIIGTVIAEIIVGTGRFSNFNPTISQLIGPIIGIFIFIGIMTFLILRYKSMLFLIKFLLKKVIIYWQLILGMIFLAASIWGIFKTNSYLILLTTTSFLLSIFLLYKFNFAQKRKNNAKIQPIFTPIPMMPGVGNRYFQEFYLDSPSGEVLLGGIKFMFQHQSLVFDTGTTARYFEMREDGCKIVKLNCPSLVEGVKTVHFLIVSGNSKEIYRNAKIGELNLIFENDSSINTFANYRAGEGWKMG